MANTSVYTGADGSITLAAVASGGPEAEAAQGIIDGNDLVSVGRATGVSVRVTSEVRAFHEIGQRYASLVNSRENSQSIIQVRILINPLDSYFTRGKSGQNYPHFSCVITF